VGKGANVDVYFVVGLVLGHEMTMMTTMMIAIVAALGLVPKPSAPS